MKKVKIKALITKNTDPMNPINVVRNIIIDWDLQLHKIIRRPKFKAITSSYEVSFVCGNKL